MGRPIFAQAAQAQEPGSEAARYTVGVLGLGLIGGSLAKAYRDAGWRVLAFDLDEDTMGAARVETIDGTLDEADTLGLAARGVRFFACRGDLGVSKCRKVSLGVPSKFRKVS